MKQKDNLVSLGDVLACIRELPAGASPAELERRLGVSRSSVNRQLRAQMQAGRIIARGNGPARRYFDADPLAAIRQYFDRPHTERPVVRYREDLLEFVPTVGVGDCAFLGHGRPLEKKEMTRFLIDFSCASSILEGGTYSLLDTQALIEYGERNSGKPLADAILVLNHKRAFEYLFDHRSLDAIFRVHDLLTDDHGMDELAGAPHFLERRFRGVAREYEDVDIAFCVYAPPFRPGTGYVGKMLGRILQNAREIADPVDGAFYLLTRIPYLQPFKDGNKRTSRALCNIPLLNAGLPPISFVDFGKRDYIVSMLAFYELGDVRMARRCFIDAYEKSARRSA